MSTLVSWPGGIKYNGSLPETVEHIGDNAFYFHRQSGKLFTLPSSVKTVGEWVFARSDFEEFILHNSLESIGKYAFADCIGLKSFDIPASVTYLGPGFVANGHFVTGLTVAEDNPSYVAVDGNVYIRDMSTFVMCAPGRKDEVTIPDGVTKILEGAFCGSFVKSVTIPEGVTTIDFRTFYAAQGLESITLPESLSSIGDYAFYYTDKLKELVIPDMVESIGENAFQESALTRLVIGENVSSIGDYAFDKVSVLKWEMDPMLVVKATTPPVVGNYCKSLYYYPLYVPKGYAEVYTEAPFWNEFNEIHEYGNLSVSMPDMSLKVGDTTESVISFEKDDDVTVVSESWTSGDTSVMTVNKDGIIEAVGRGQATLNYVAKDNYGIPHKASCLVSVSTDTGIDGITDTIDGGETSVYNLQGVYVGTDCSGLQPGLYIICKNGRTKKVLVN